MRRESGQEAFVQKTSLLPKQDTMLGTYCRRGLLCWYPFLMALSSELLCQRYAGNGDVLLCSVLPGAWLSPPLQLQPWSLCGTSAPAMGGRTAVIGDTQLPGSHDLERCYLISLPQLYDSNCYIYNCQSLARILVSLFCFLQV